MNHYEQCVLDADGLCSRFSHNHESVTPDEPAPLTEERIREVVRDELYTFLAIADIRARGKAGRVTTLLIETLSQIILQRRERKYPARGGIVVHDKDKRRVYVFENRR